VSSRANVDRKEANAFRGTAGLAPRSHRALHAASGSREEPVVAWVPLQAADRSHREYLEISSPTAGENMRTSRSRIAVPIVAGLLCAAASAQVTQRVSVATGGGQSNDYSEWASISADGRCVSFLSAASNLVPGDTNGAWDVFVRDRNTGITERVSVDSFGNEGNDYSSVSSLSADGRFVAFRSWATNLVPGDTNGMDDIFVRDRLLGTTERISVDSSGTESNGSSDYPSISADGRYVAFESFADNLVPGDSNADSDVFVRDRQLGTTELATVDSNGTPGNNSSGHPTISPDGRYVTFYSYSNNLVPGDTNQYSDIFIRDRQLGVTERVSVSSNGAQGLNNSGDPYYFACPACVSADGRFVAFFSSANNLVPGDTNFSEDIFVRDRQLALTERVSISSGGAQGDNDSWGASISSDGRYVSFFSYARNLVPNDTGGSDAFVRDRQLGTTERASISSSGVQGDGYSPSISADGRYVAFHAAASSLVPDDTNGAPDIFVRDRFGGTSYTSLCDPGVNGVVPCPCSNAPLIPGLGCDNSSGTGGAELSASGGTYVSSDSLVFTTNGETSAALSIVMQGNVFLANGVAYGQGVRCVGGATKRLFVKSAVAGSITAPDFGVGDATVSARSASKGDVIQPGQSRWYLVYYRDPIVLGGCSASSTFNATQTGQVTWWP